jgi:hypothetical protein
LVDVAFDSSWLWEEEIANHGNVVRHDGDGADTLSAFKLSIHGCLDFSRWLR